MELKLKVISDIEVGKARIENIHVTDYGTVKDLIN